MREITTAEISACVAKLCIKANIYLNDDIKNAFCQAAVTETSPLGGEILQQLLENATIAREQQMPLCQDTGMAVIFLEVGQDLHIAGGNFEEAINEGVRRGYCEGYLRKSVVDDPLFVRKNTGDNTPAIIHTQIVAGEQLKITVAPKGFGSENMSQLKMLKPADGVDGVKEFVLNTIREAGANPCPPIVVGVGVGGTMEKAAFLAKKALLREVGSTNPHPEFARLEQELLTAANQLMIGPQGFGGKTTALGMNIEFYPTHIAGLPVAVNINCHCTRHAEEVL